MQVQKDDLAEMLAEQLMPGWTVVRSGSGQRPESGYKDSLVEAGVKIVAMPSLEKLKAKYAGIGAADTFRGAKSDANVVGNDADTAIVNLQNGPLTKTVAVSRSQNKVVWSQG